MNQYVANREIVLIGIPKRKENKKLPIANAKQFEGSKSSSGKGPSKKEAGPACMVLMHAAAEVQSSTPTTQMVSHSFSPGSIRNILTSSRIMSPPRHRHTLASHASPDTDHPTTSTMSQQMDAPRRTLRLLRRGNLPSLTRYSILGRLRLGCYGRRHCNGPLVWEIGNDGCVYSRRVS